MLYFPDTGDVYNGLYLSLFDSSHTTSYQLSIVKLSPIFFDLVTRSF